MRLRPSARGWSFAAVAVVLLVAAPVLGQRDVLRVGVLLAGLLAVAGWSAVRSARTLDLVSRSKSELVEAGVASTVRLSVLGRSRAGVRLVLEDRAPLALGGTVRLAVPRLAEGQTLDLEYRVRSEVRGSYPLGPATLLARDVFGLVTASRTVGDAVTLDVLPRVHPLADLTLGELGGARGSSAGASAAVSPDDVSIREYRVGDDLRRVHWRSTARRGAVMVRSDEHPGRPDVVLLLDSRAQAHAGRGAGSSLEWAVSLTASAAVHLHRRGHRVRLLHDGAFDPPRELDDTSAVRGLLRALSRLGPGAPDGLARSAAVLGRADSTLLVAVLGGVDEDDVAPLLSVRPMGVPALAVLARTAAWARPGSGRRARPAPRAPGAGPGRVAHGARRARGPGAGGLGETVPHRSPRDPRRSPPPAPPGPPRSPTRRSTRDPQRPHRPVGGSRQCGRRPHPAPARGVLGVAGGRAGHRLRGDGRRDARARGAPPARAGGPRAGPRPPGRAPRAVRREHHHARGPPDRRHPAPPRPAGHRRRPGDPALQRAGRRPAGPAPAAGDRGGAGGPRRGPVRRHPAPARAGRGAAAGRGGGAAGAGPRRVGRGGLRPHQRPLPGAAGRGPPRHPPAPGRRPPPVGGGGDRERHGRGGPGRRDRRAGGGAGPGRATVDDRPPARATRSR